jgi:hypothetical protein
VKRLEGALNYYVQQAAEHTSDNTSPCLPYPDLAPGQKPTHEQLVDMMASLGAATLHFYCVLYAVTGEDPSKMSDAAVKALSQLDGALVFLPAMRHVLSAVLEPAGDSSNGGYLSHTSADLAVREAATTMLPAPLLEVIRKQNSEWWLCCGKFCNLPVALHNWVRQHITNAHTLLLLQHAVSR